MSEQPPTATPPGWYPDPRMPGTQRYWNGGEWSEHVAPGVMHAPPGQHSSSLEAAGWILAVFLPVAGLVIGIVMAGKSQPRALGVIGLSVVALAVAYAALSNQQTY